MLALIALLMTTAGLVILGYRVVAIAKARGFWNKVSAFRNCFLDWFLSISLALVGSYTGGVTGGSAGLLAGPIISILISRSTKHESS